jgi:hypothetical protein
MVLDASHSKRYPTENGANSSSCGLRPRFAWPRPRSNPKWKQSHLQKHSQTSEHMDLSTWFKQLNHVNRVNVDTWPLCHVGTKHTLKTPEITAACPRSAKRHIRGLKMHQETTKRSQDEPKRTPKQPKEAQKTS